MPGWSSALLWGLVSGGALVLGAGIGYRFDVPARSIARMMAFGAGVLISALAFDLLDEAYRTDGWGPTAIGFMVGALAYHFINLALIHEDGEPAHDGTVIAMGALLRGIPEAIVIGLAFLKGGAKPLAMVTAFIFANFPEGLASADRMKRAGQSRRFIFRVWGSITLTTGVAALLGWSIFSRFAPSVIAATEATAAGTILVMLVDTMIPEAFADTAAMTGIITALGFILAFSVSALEH